MSGRGDHDGNLIEDVIDITGPSATWPSVAYDEANQVYLVVWEDSSGYESVPMTQCDIMGQFVNAQNGELIGDSFAICNDGYDQHYPHVAYNSASGNFMVIWHENDDELNTYGRLVRFNPATNQGELLGSGKVLVGDHEGVVAPWGQHGVVGSGIGGKFFVAWADDRDENYNFSIRGRFVDAETGVLLGLEDIVIQSDLANSYYSPAVAAGGGKVLVTWTDYSDTFGRYVDAGTMSPVGDSFAVAGDPGKDESEPSNAYNSTSTNFFTAFVLDESEIDFTITGTDQFTLNPGSPLTIAGNPTALIGDKETPCAVYDPVNNQYFVVYTAGIVGDERLSNIEGVLVATNETGPPPPTDIIYVKWDAEGEIHDGTSWGKAFTTLQEALDAVGTEGYENVNQIWMAKGTYYPTSDYGLLNDDDETDPSLMHFRMKNGLAIYGGFTGTETQRSQRDWEANETILSGTTGISGEDGDGTYYFYTCHVFYHPDELELNNSAVLDGFTITQGHASGESQHRMGGGMYNHHCSPALTNIVFKDNYAAHCGGGIVNYESSPALTNVIFNDNRAASGGGMANAESSPSLTNVTFSNNTSFGLETCGGGMYNYNSSPVLENVDFIDNKAEKAWGGGMYNEGGSPVLNNVAFRGNHADFGGGGIYNIYHLAIRGNTSGGGGGDAPAPNYSSLQMTNVVFYGNTTTNGGGGGIDNYGTLHLTNVAFYGNSASGNGGGLSNNPGSRSNLTNCSFAGNHAGWKGGGLENQDCITTISNCIIWGNTADESDARIYSYDNATVNIDHSLIQGCGGSGEGWDSGLGDDLGGNIDADPLFVNAADGNLRLQEGSPAINMGSNDALPSDVTTDLDGNSRISGGTVDMGAYEYQGGSVNTYTLTLSANPEAGGTVTGAGSYAEGASVTVTAAPKSGYSFTNWSEGTNIISSSATYNFTMGAAARTLVANFTKNIGGGGGGGGGGGSTQPRIEPVQVPEEPQVSAPAEEPSDLSGHWAHDCIMALLQHGIIAGYPDGTIRPENEITRAEAAALLVSALGLQDYQPQSMESPYQDEIPAWAKKAILTATEKKLMKGYPDGTFRPDQRITRAEMCTALMQAFPKETPAGFVLGFTDSDSVPDWARPFVESAAGSQVVSGYPDNTFRPGSNIKRGEAFSIICRLMGYHAEHAS